MATPTFDISPEWRASTLHYWYRQLFKQAAPLTRRDADLKGKTAIVTGANNGIGLEAARQILDLGGTVIMAVRDEGRGEAARQSLLRDQHDISPSAVQVWKLDLSSYDSILSFTERVKTSLPNLDIAILSAGVFKRHETFNPTTGYEETMQVNYLSNALLLLLLLPIIRDKKTGPGSGHISFLSSEVAGWAKGAFLHHDPMLPEFKKPQDFGAMGFQEYYANSKLLGLLFLSELARHVSAEDVVVNAPNPGFCKSDFGREVDGLVRVAFKASMAVLARTTAVGARTVVRAATVLGTESHGQYVEDGRIQPMPPLLYTPEGERLARQLYEETLDDLSFAGGRSIVEGMAVRKE